MAVPPTAEVLVLGAGIAGCALAYHLSRRGVGPVILYDPRTPAAGATGRAAGIVTEQLWNRWDVEVTRESKAEYAGLCARWEPSAYSVNGFVRWASGDGAKQALAAATTRQRSWGVDVREIDLDRLTELVPQGRFDDHPSAVYGESDAVVTPSTMTGIYSNLAREAGAKEAFGAPWASFRRDSQGWELVTASGILRSRAAVVAAGAWSKRILQTLGHALPLAPYRTQAAVLRPELGKVEFASLHDIDTDVYARPEGKGRVLAGDGTELVEVDPDTYRSGADDSFAPHLAEVFDRRIPAWAGAELVRAWAGVCTATPDRRPLVGPVAGEDSLYVMAGFNGFGVMRAGGVAERLTDLLASGGHGNREIEQLSPVLPERFARSPAPFDVRPGFTLEDGDDPRY